MLLYPVTRRVEGRCSGQDFDFFLVIDPLPTLKAGDFTL